MDQIPVTLSQRIAPIPEILVSVKTASRKHPIRRQMHPASRDRETADPTRRDPMIVVRMDARGATNGCDVPTPAKSVQVARCRPGEDSLQNTTRPGVKTPTVVVMALIVNPGK